MAYRWDPLRVRVDLGVITRRHEFRRPWTPELESYHQMQFTVIPRITRVHFFCWGWWWWWMHTPLQNPNAFWKQFVFWKAKKKKVFFFVHFSLDNFSFNLDTFWKKLVFRRKLTFHSLFISLLVNTTVSVSILNTPWKRKLTFHLAFLSLPLSLPLSLSLSHSLSVQIQSRYLKKNPRFSLPDFPSLPCFPWGFINVYLGGGRQMFNPNTKSGQRSTRNTGTKSSPARNLTAY